uniref:H15 domain-containing protein n=3 Tax=Rhodnius prolixus TaxID=13249 RepID=T1IEP6_RHOPR
MTETTEQPAVETSPTVGKKAKASPKKKAGPKTANKKASHPPTSQMVTAAIKDLKERGGSSLQAIKKYISTTYNVDAEKMSLFIRKYIKSAVETGELVQTKGKGAAGSFRLGGSDNTAKSKKKTTTTTTKQAKPAKKPATEKKAPASKKKAAVVKKKEAPAAAPKVKKTKKPPTTPKAPKPKKATPTKAKKAS